MLVDPYENLDSWNHLFYNHVLYPVRDMWWPWVYDMSILLSTTSKKLVWMYRQRAYQLKLLCILRLDLNLVTITNLHHATMENLLYHLKLSVSLLHRKEGPRPWKEQPVYLPGSKQDPLVESYCLQINVTNLGVASFVKRAPTSWTPFLGKKGFFVLCVGKFYASLYGFFLGMYDQDYLIISLSWVV